MKMHIERDTKLYVVTRKDLPHGARAAQAVHAAIKFALVHASEAAAWNLFSNNVVVLEAPDEASLRELWERIGRHVFDPDLLGVQFCEPDMGDQLTAVAMMGPAVRHYTSHLPLALKNVHRDCVFVAA